MSYTGSAVLRLFGPDVDDSKIDSSKAVVKLLPGDGYYAGELVLKADSLKGQWKDGALEYTLKTGDLEWYTGGYEYTDDNSGREWSVLGGDGNGVYNFNFEVSGITYGGQPVNAAAFPVQVYIWGRTGTDLAPAITDLVPENHLPSGVSQGRTAQWNWKGEQGDFMGGEAKPVLSDDKQDDFFITWPTGTDAGRVTAKDVAVTLSTQYGEKLQLTASGEHPQYAVFSSKGETQVAVTFRHAAFTPVFNSLTIEVDGGSGLTASKTYDIASVYSYMVQQGGGLPADGVCTAYSYYGYEGLSIDNAQKASYTLKYTDANGTTWYYNEKGGLSEAVEKTTQGFMGPVTALAAPDDAAVYDAMGKDVSYALMPYDGAVYDIQTKASSASATGYTTTITVKDDGYENVYAFGDWVAVDKDGKLHGPGEWANGMNYATSSALPLTKNADGNWELKIDLASSVMGVICYHDVADAKDLENVKPLKTSFCVPYDSEKQSGSFDWTPAFPASETGVAAGRVYDATCTVDGTALNVSVYTPAGYDADKDGGYPVACLIPGGGSNYLSWFKDGMVSNVFDNLIAAGKVKPTILVSMQREDVNGDNGRCLPGIISWVEANFNAAQGAKNRALVDVSMGSVAATQLWLDDPEQFQYYGFLSGGDKDTFKGAGQEGAEFTYGELDGALLAKLKATTCYLGGGTTDFNMYEGDANSASVTDLDAWMAHYGIPHNAKGDGKYAVTAGDHNWPIWMKLMIPCASDYLWK